MIAASKRKKRISAIVLILISSIAVLAVGVFLLRGSLYPLDKYFRYFTYWMPEDSSIGFFSPERVDKFASMVNFSQINVYPVDIDGSIRVNLEMVKKNLEYVSNYYHRINLDLGPLITDIVEPSELNRDYINSEGETVEKVFRAKKKNKLRRIVSSEEIARRVEGLPELVQSYRNNVGTIYLVDEPYLNGVSKDDINRAAQTLEVIFEQNGIHGLKFGIIFAAGLFSPDFAAMINERMMRYVERIDQYYRAGAHLLENDGPESESFRSWVRSIEDSRLTTYDSANNIYISGGIPEEIDVVAFDFYLSTLLFDQIHEHTLHYFADALGIEECLPFLNKTVSTLRTELSFVRDGPVDNDYGRDKKILDEVFDCRMAGGMHLLSESLENLDRKPELMLIGESSANGVMEFNSKGIIEKDQPKKLVEKRVLNEVRRSYEFYTNNTDIFSRGLIYFLYPDTIDYSIDLYISGAESTQSVKDFIYSHTIPPAILKPNLSFELNPFLLRNIAVDKQMLANYVDADYIINILAVKRRSIKIDVASTVPDLIRARTENNRLHLRYIPADKAEVDKVAIIIRLTENSYSETHRFEISILDKTRLSPSALSK